jgi:hypothetical protein
MAPQIRVRGIDIAILGFPVVGVDDTGRVGLRKRLARRELPHFSATLPTRSLTGFPHQILTKPSPHPHDFQADRG